MPSIPYLKWPCIRNNVVNLLLHFRKELVEDSRSTSKVSISKKVNIKNERFFGLFMMFLNICRTRKRREGNTLFQDLGPAPDLESQGKRDFMEPIFCQVNVQIRMETNQT